MFCDKIPKYNIFKVLIYLHKIKSFIFFLSDFRSANNFTSNAVGYERAIHMDDDGDDSPNVQSDIDSQVSSILLLFWNIFTFINNTLFKDVITKIIHTATRIQVQSARTKSNQKWEFHYEHKQQWW